jgi:hypothetical protein
MDNTGTTKRLSFGDLAADCAPDLTAQEEVIRALKNPCDKSLVRCVAAPAAAPCALSAARIARPTAPPIARRTPHPAPPSAPPRSAVEVLGDGYLQRFDLLLAAAREQSAAVGEADERRLRRQFSSLKNTFLHYEVKDLFIGALADGQPNGTEDIQLAQWEAEAARNVERLRGLKGRNGEAAAEIGDLIAEIAAALEAAGERRGAAAAALARLQAAADEAATAAAAGGAPGAAEPAPGPEEEACAAELAAEAAAARKLEEALAAELAEAAEAGPAAAAEREDAEAARALAADLRAAAGAAAAGGAAPAPVGAAARFAAAEAWADEAGRLLAALGGVALAEAPPAEGGAAPPADEAVLDLRLTTSYPTAAVAAGCVGACAKGAHVLRLELGAPAAAGGARPVAAAALSPPDVEVADIVAAAAAAGRGADFVVREVRARLAGFLHRRALAREAEARFAGATTAPGARAVRAPLGGGAAAEVRLEAWWPEGDDLCVVADVTGVDAAAAEALRGLRVEGRGPAAALEAVAAALAAPPA